MGLSCPSAFGGQYLITNYKKAEVGTPAEYIPGRPSVQGTSPRASRWPCYHVSVQEILRKSRSQSLERPHSCLYNQENNFLQDGFNELTYDTDGNKFRNFASLLSLPFPLCDVHHNTSDSSSKRKDRSQWVWRLTRSLPAEHHTY